MQEYVHTPRQMLFANRIYDTEKTPVRLGNRTYRSVKITMVLL